MNELMVTSYVKIGIALQNLRDRLESRRKRGADALEYVGMIVLAALIVVGIVGAVNIDTIKSTVESNVTKILTGK